jgi:hypothetical protein
MTSKRVIAGTAALGGVAAVASVHLRLLSPEQIGVAAAMIAGGITVLTSAVAAMKSVSTDKKVDNISVLVDGRYGEVLRELADVRGILAQRSGSEKDIERAVSARAESDAQVARVTAVEAKK